MKNTKDETPLYAYRSVLNPEPLCLWASENGITIEDPSKLHVTVCYSKTPVKWKTIVKDSKQLHLQGNPRHLAILGDENALVLKFFSCILQERWSYYQNKGAVWSYPSYQPHITLSYKDHKKFNLSKPVAFNGDILLGSENLEPLNTEWSPD